MTSVTELLQALENATEPDRRLDRLLAVATGWARDSGGGHGERRFVWSYPGEEKKPREQFPKFTESVDAALELVGFITDASTVGIAWEGDDGNGKVKLDEHEPVTAANPAIALCIAAVKAAT